MSLYLPSKVAAPRVGFTEFEILKASHKFLRDENPEEDGKANSKSWNEQLAKKYYENLYREFAVCDLKHYKSGNFALRWRTEDEVLSGAGETTCANTRCEYHHATTPTYSKTSFRDTEQSRSKVPLTTLELPFAYEEHGEHKSALVKIVLCDRCVQKLMYKKNKEKKKAMKTDRARERTLEDKGDDGERDREVEKGQRQTSRLPGEEDREREKKTSSQGNTDPAGSEERRRKRNRDEDHRQDNETDGRHRHKHRKHSRSSRHAS